MIVTFVRGDESKSETEFTSTYARLIDELEAGDRVIATLMSYPDTPLEGVVDSLGWVYYMRARPLMERGSRDDALAMLERARDRLGGMANVDVRQLEADHRLGCATHQAPATVMDATRSGGADSWR